MLFNSLTVSKTNMNYIKENKMTQKIVPLILKILYFRLNYLKSIYKTSNKEVKNNMSYEYQDKSLPNRFKQCRIDANIDIDTMINLLKVQRRSIRNYESSLSIPSVPNLIKMHRIYEVSLDYLMHIDDYRNHFEYMQTVLGIDDELLALLSSITNFNHIKRINNFIKNHYKEYVK